MTWDDQQILKYYKFNEIERSEEKTEGNLKYKLLKPLEKKSDEYELAIKSFLGVTLKNKEQRKFSDDGSRSKSTAAIHYQAKKDYSWIEELHKITEKERIIQQSLKELELTRTSPIKHKINYSSYQKLPVLKGINDKEISPIKIFSALEEASLRKDTSSHKVLPHKELSHKEILHKEIPQQKEIVQSLHKVHILLQKVLKSSIVKQKKQPQ